MSEAKQTLGETHFDNNARRWDENPVFQERGRKIAAAIRELVPLDRSMAVLDYGCGTGLLSFPLKDELGPITMADSSAGMLAVLREKIAAQGVANMAVEKLDLLADPLPAQRFDLIYTAMTLHHILDTNRILGIFHELLKPGGHLCIADLDQEDGSFHGLEYDVHHGFDREELARKAERDGFDDIRFRTAFEIVKEKETGPRAYPVFLMAARRT
jgi:ubiquinone/menaquinone biosynthesis C-methylase UbiE